ncbi:MAG TPA: hypothetical protein VIG40_07450 [Tissierellaceae bacterium]
MEYKTLILFIVLTIISSTTSTLRSMFLARKQFKANYIATFLDALIFATLMKKISAGDGIVYALSYAIGRTLGAYFGHLIEGKMALGIIQIDISVNHFDKMVQIADELRDLGYAVETNTSFGYGGKKRYKIVVTISRAEVGNLRNVLSKYGYDEPTLIIKDVSNVSGKITVRPEEE